MKENKDWHFNNLHGSCLTPKVTTTPIVEVTVTDHGINPLQDYSHIQLSWQRKLATIKDETADVLSVSPSSEWLINHSIGQLLSNEGLTLETSAFLLFMVANSNYPLYSPTNAAPQFL